jgi:hypothetical protein
MIPRLVTGETAAQKLFAPVQDGKAMRANLLFRHDEGVAWSAQDPRERLPS